MAQHLCRTRFKRDIVAEYCPPRRRISSVKKRQRPQDVVIFAGGAPGYTGGKRDIAEWLAEEGYWSIFLRYRGTWESDGEFLARSPHEDVLDVVDALTRGAEARFKDIISQEMVAFTPGSIFVVGSSFGGPAAILASRDERVTGAVAIASVVDWRKPGPAESHDEFVRLTKEAFGGAYRTARGGFKKLFRGRFYNPAHEPIASFRGDKLLFVHNEDDDVCPFPPVRRFARALGAPLVSYKRGGHGSTSTLLKPHVSRRTLTFFRRAASRASQK